MSDNLNSSVNRYLQRETSMLGRAVNIVTDWGRELAGKQPLWLTAADQESVSRSSFGAAEIAIANSGLDATYQKKALSMIQNFELQYPERTPELTQLMVVGTIDFMKEEAEKRLERNQMNLFTEGLIQEAQPSINRERGTRVLEELGNALAAAEGQMVDKAMDPENLGPWDCIEDRMEDVQRNPDAMALVAEWGFKANEFGVLQTARGTEITSRDIMKHVELEKSLSIANDNDHGYGH